MLDYAVKLNGDPSATSAEDVASLRAAGFDDQAVMDIVMVVALFNFMNRMADGLGVQLDEAILKSHQRGTARAEEALRGSEAPAQQAGAGD